MSIDEFKALPALPTDTSGSGIRCSASTTADEAASGGLEYSRSGDSPFETLTLTSYEFGPDAQGTIRLYRIMLTSQNDNFLTANSGLLERWGKPSRVDNTPTENGLGMRIEKHRYIWVRGLSVFVLVSLC